MRKMGRGLELWSNQIRTTTPLSTASNASSSLSNVSTIPSSETFVPESAKASCKDSSY